MTTAHLDEIQHPYIVSMSVPQYMQEITIEFAGTPFYPPIYKLDIA